MTGMEGIMQMRIMMAFVIIMQMAPAPMTAPAMAMDAMAAAEGMGGIAGRRQDIGSAGQDEKGVRAAGSEISKG
jgi:hypothetical protein